MSAPDIFLLMDRSGRPLVIETIRRLCTDGNIYRDEDHEVIVDWGHDWLTFDDFDLCDYILFSSDFDNFDQIVEVLQGFKQPYVCCLQTRNLAKVNEIVFALQKQIDFAMDNDHGRLIASKDFLKFYEAGTDWLRLPPG